MPHYKIFMNNILATNIPMSKKSFNDYMIEPENNKTFFFSPTDPVEISRVITNLKPKSSCGFDGISSKLLKSIHSGVCYPLSIIINKSFESGIVPRDVKLAKVIPLFKAKDKCVLGNYRPISLLPSISKVMEEIVHKQTF
jgi:hypothetical protein